GTGVDLDTTVANLTVATTGAGNTTIREADGANVLNVSAASGNASVSSTTGDLNVTTVSASGTAPLVATAGAITDANGASNNVTAAKLAAIAANGIATSGDPLEMTVSNVEASNTGVGGVFFVNVGTALQIGNVSAGITGINSTNGSISVTNNN